MPVNAAAENVLGTIGTICWAGQLIPQIWKSWREHSTEGLSHLLVLLWGLSSIFLGTYAIVQNLNIPLIVQPQLFAFLALFSWGQCMHYGKRKPLLTASLMAASVMLIVGALQVGFVFALRPSMNRRAIDFFGIFASVLISVGLLPQYWEIIKRKEVIGISIPFLMIDISGGVFSDLSLIFRPQFDVIAAVAYTLVVVLDGLIVVAALILNPRARKKRKAEAEMRQQRIVENSIIPLNATASADTGEPGVSTVPTARSSPSTSITV